MGIKQLSEKADNGTPRGQINILWLTLLQEPSKKQTVTPSFSPAFQRVDR